MPPIADVAERPFDGCFVPIAAIRRPHRLRDARLQLYSARKSSVASAITTGYAAITDRVGNVGAFGRHYS